jgi:hypothetical protein
MQTALRQSPNAVLSSMIGTILIGTIFFQSLHWVIVSIVVLGSMTLFKKLFPAAKSERRFNDDRASSQFRP